MNNQTLAFLNVLALALLFLPFVPWNGRIAQVLILVVAVVLFLKKR